MKKPVWLAAERGPQHAFEPHDWANMRDPRQWALCRMVCLGDSEWVARPDRPLCYICARYAGVKTS